MKHLRKIQLMHHLFGKREDHKCGQCSNFREYRYENIYRKCKVYGCTSSEASDWAKSWQACGMFGESYGGVPVIKNRVNLYEKEAEAPIEGQQSLFCEDKQAAAALKERENDG